MTNFWNTILGKVIKFILPWLREAAEKSFNKLPKEEQEKLKSIALLVQIVKLGYEKKLPIKTIIANMVNQSGLTYDTVQVYFIEYWRQKGQDVGSLEEAVKLIIEDASMRTETGLKSLWNGIVNLIAGVVTNVDWQALLFGLVQYVYERYVKGRVKI